VPNQPAPGSAGIAPRLTIERHCPGVPELVRRDRMDVSVTIDLSVPPQEEHVAAMRQAARSLTDDPSSVRVSCPTTSPRQVCAHFTVPDARQEDVVDRIGRRFWQVDDYQDSSIGFSRRRTRRIG